MYVLTSSTLLSSSYATVLGPQPSTFAQYSITFWHLIWIPLGRGAVFTADGTHEMEASIMDGSSIQFVNVLKEAETEEQNALRDFFEDLWP